VFIEVVVVFVVVVVVVVVYFVITQSGSFWRHPLILEERTPTPFTLIYEAWRAPGLVWAQR
jgi:hypothetical protein